MSGGIGFELDEECEPAPTVGDGCASLTAVEEENGLDACVRAIRKLRKMGAVRVKMGDVEVEFCQAPPADRAPVTG